MESILIVVVAFVGYLVAYNTYGRYLSQKVFRLDADKQTPPSASSGAGCRP